MTTWLTDSTVTLSYFVLNDILELFCWGCPCCNQFVCLILWRSIKDYLYVEIKSIFKLFQCKFVQAIENWTSWRLKSLNRTSVDAVSNCVVLMLHSGLSNYPFYPSIHHSPIHPCVFQDCIHEVLILQALVEHESITCQKYGAPVSIVFVLLVCLLPRLISLSLITLTLFDIGKSTIPLSPIQRS